MSETTKYKYIGTEEQNLAGVGVIVPGQIVGLTLEQAAGVEKNAPEQFEEVREAPERKGSLKPIPVQIPNTKVAGDHSVE